MTTTRHGNGLPETASERATLLQRSKIGISKIPRAHGFGRFANFLVGEGKVWAARPETEQHEVGDHWIEHPQRHSIGIATINAHLHVAQQVSDPAIGKSLWTWCVHHAHGGLIVSLRVKIG